MDNPKGRRRRQPQDEQVQATNEAQNPDQAAVNNADNQEQLQQSLEGLNVDAPVIVTATAPQDAPQQDAPQQAAPQQAAPQQAAPQQAAPKQAAPKQAAPKQAASTQPPAVQPATATVSTTVPLNVTATINVAPVGEVSQAPAQPTTAPATVTKEVVPAELIANLVKALNETVDNTVFGTTELNIDKVTDTLPDDVTLEDLQAAMPALRDAFAKDIVQFPAESNEANLLITLRDLFTNTAVLNVPDQTPPAAPKVDVAAHTDELLRGTGVKSGNLTWRYKADQTFTAGELAKIANDPHVKGKTAASDADIANAVVGTVSANRGMLAKLSKV
jgi:hypothetical protein